MALRSTCASLPCIDRAYHHNLVHVRLLDSAKTSCTYSRSRTDVREVVKWVGEHLTEVGFGALCRRFFQDIVAVRPLPILRFTCWWALHPMLKY